MPIIHDKEFGEITIRRSAKSKQVKIRVAPNGKLHASTPMYSPILLVKHLIKNSRPEIREIISKSMPKYNFVNGMTIGKSHTLIIQSTDNTESEVVKHGQQIIVKLPSNKSISDTDVTNRIRESMTKALKIEAKSYLPRRLSYLSKELGLHYDKSRFSHSSGRWGSCSSNGTISLNIALMKLPFELIDYVIVHELSHTKQMNHGSEFWNLVEVGDHNYKKHRLELKSHSPTI